ncbi:MAG TPA: S53 family peptidase [Streptosporangiaceae bacterium]|jgi:subtilase family serine protease|nr:S53 family peptidase [Streptosporangiaceae bacterium]
MPQVTRLRVVCAAVAAGALTLGTLAATTAAQAGTARRAIADSHPAWAVAAKRLSSTASGTVNAKVYLAPSNAAGLAGAVAAVSNPKSADYRHFWSAARIRAEFTPSAADIAGVRSWLTSAGLSVTRINTNIAGSYVAVRGSVAAASKAFGVTFGTYRGPGGQAARAPEQTATAPASVASSVLAVAGLDTAKSQIKPALPPPGPNYWITPNCSTYYGQKVATNKPKAYGSFQPWTNCGYTPPQVRGAYGVTSTTAGAGQTVAIVDAYSSPTMLADANQFATLKDSSVGPFTSGQYQQFKAGPYTLAAANECDAQGWYGEETLDVESVHGMAPGANVRYVGAGSCLDSDLAQADALIVNRGLASIVSNSWGEPAQYSTINDVFDSIFQLGALRGIGFFFSSGDSGYEAPGEDPISSGRQVDVPTSSPYVTSVGGTSLAIGATDNYQWETSWGTLLDPLVYTSTGKKWQYTPPGKYPAWYGGSGGGGVSTAYSQPAYQAGVVPTSLAEALPNGTTSSSPMRVIPDVSALADPSTGIAVGQTTLQPNGTSYAFSLSRIGGTSVACPVFAGIEADAQQAVGGALGFANPAIYYLDTNFAYGTSNAAYNDVTEHPLGPGYLAEVRNNYTNPYTKQGPLLTYLRTLGLNGEGKDRLKAVTGYDDATGVGSPKNYIQDAPSLP